MTIDQISELTHNYINNNYKDPTTLIVERVEYEKFVKETIGLMTYNPTSWTGNKITVMCITLRVIFATNLDDKEVIVL